MTLFGIWNLVESEIFLRTIRSLTTLTTHHSRPDHHKCPFFGSNQPFQLLGSSLRREAVDRYRETSELMSTHPHSARPALHRVLHRVAANDNQASVHVF